MNNIIETMSNQVQTNDLHEFKNYIEESNLKDYTNIKYAPSDFRGAALRGKSNKDLAIESGNDIKKVCDLPLDYRTKLSICLDIDKLLYTNFVRNETQKAVYR